MLRPKKKSRSSLSSIGSTSKSKSKARHKDTPNQENEDPYMLKNCAMQEEGEPLIQKILSAPIRSKHLRHSSMENGIAMRNRITGCRSQSLVLSDEQFTSQQSIQSNSQMPLGNYCRMVETASPQVKCRTLEQLPMRILQFRHRCLQRLQKQMEFEINILMSSKNQQHMLQRLIQQNCQVLDRQKETIMDLSHRLDVKKHLMGRHLSSLSALMLEVDIARLELELRKPNKQQIEKRIAEQSREIRQLREQLCVLNQDIDKKSIKLGCIRKKINLLQKKTSLSKVKRK